MKEKKETSFQKVQRKLLKLSMAMRDEGMPPTKFIFTESGRFEWSPAERVAE